MKILIVGDWHSELHEVAIYQALLQLGHEPMKFAWHGYFEPKSEIGKLSISFFKAQNKFMFGPMVNRMNRDLINQVRSDQPDVVFVYRGTHIFPETLKRIRHVVKNAVLVGYNNDDPFSPDYPKWQWRHFLAGIPEYDLVLAFRLHNINELKAAKAKRVELLRHWFIPERNHPVDLTIEERKRFECDVVFIGHYEDDGRLTCLEEIVRHGWSLRLFGHGNEWEPVIRNSKELKDQLPVELVWGADYNRAICGAKVALCFFSKLNRDTYTTRCFEIPASGTVLMSEYSDDMAEMFEPDREAVFFRNPEELQSKLNLLFSNEKLMESIAVAGTQRVWKDGHDVVSRIGNMLKTL